MALLLLNPLPGEIWQHAKGGLYEIVARARNSNDCMQELVVYKSLQASDFPVGTVWVRSLTEFSSPGRFTLLEGLQLSKALDQAINEAVAANAAPKP